MKTFCEQTPGGRNAIIRTAEINFLSLESAHLLLCVRDVPEKTLSL
jgi:hypothetical protein